MRTRKRSGRLLEDVLLPNYNLIIFHVRRGDRNGICKVVCGVMWSKSNLLKYNQKYLLCRGRAKGRGRDEQRKLSSLVIPATGSCRDEQRKMPSVLSLYLFILTFQCCRGERDGGSKVVIGVMWSKSSELWLNRNYLLCRGWATGSVRDRRRSKRANGPNHLNQVILKLSSFLLNYRCRCKCNAWSEMLKSNVN